MKQKTNRTPRMNTCLCIQDVVRCGATGDCQLSVATQLTKKQRQAQWSPTIDTSRLLPRKSGDPKVLAVR